MARSAERKLFSVGGRLLRLFMPQVAEASRNHPSFSVGSGCMELSVFREDKGPQKNFTKTRPKNVSYKMYKDVGITMPKNIQTRCGHGSMQ